MQIDRHLVKYLIFGLSCVIFGFLVGKSQYGDQLVFVGPSGQVLQLVNKTMLIPVNTTKTHVEKPIGLQPISVTATTQTPRVCNVFDLQKKSSDTHQCIMTKWNPSFRICLHPIAKDIHVSGSLKRAGIWEAHVLKVFQNLLNKDKDLAIIDIGANIGQYSLLGAAMGRPVLAVEARLLHVQMIHKALTMDNRQNANLVLLHNAVSDKRGTLHLTLTEANNQGHTQVTEGGSKGAIGATEQASVPAVQMDDLLEVIRFKKAIMKIDIEGHEHRAMMACEKLLSQVDIPYIFMEWLWQKSMAGPQKIITDVLKKYNYEPFGIGKNRLTWGTIRGWPTDIIWKKANANF